MFLSFQQAGLHPTAEQIELFAYHLPKATLSNLIVSNHRIHFLCCSHSAAFNFMMLFSLSLGKSDIFTEGSTLNFKPI